MNKYVCGFYSDGHRVALMRKMKPKWQNGRLNGIGGKVEEGESPIAAMVREFREETGHDTQFDDWKASVVLVGLDWDVHFFSMKGYSFQYRPEACDPAHIASGETMEWVDQTELPPSVLPNLRWLIPLSFDKDLQFPIEVRDNSVPELNGATVKGNTNGNQ